MEFVNKDRINKLKLLIEKELTPLIDGDYALIDVPNYRNIGDNLIWKGELDFLNTIPFKNFTTHCTLFLSFIGAGINRLVFFQTTMEANLGFVFTDDVG